MNYLHRCPIIHRDIKLANIVVKSIDSNSNSLLEVKVTDFGFSTYYDPQSDEYLQKIGSGIYKAPELFGREKISEKVDIWAIGIIAYTLLGGHSNFPFKTKDEVLKADPKFT